MPAKETQMAAQIAKTLTKAVEAARWN